MQVELVRTVTRDGLRLDGALAHVVQPDATVSRASLDPHPSSLPEGEGTTQSPNNRFGASAAILLHGVASNFYTSSTFEPLIGRLNEIGVAALSVNTRGHDLVFGASLGTVRRRLGAS